ncbi:GH13930 [Drosophila grimshawi]|uniref:GH13930 n=1 Tax=Drosophila grimshawi TaxID=7222 RepID=B4K192_DROGR|nr:GH13930 [Drosophila grimshawi]
MATKPPTLASHSRLVNSMAALLRNTIIKETMDFNEIAVHFDKMVRKHDGTRVLNQARRMYFEYLQAHRKQQFHKLYIS